MKIKKIYIENFKGIKDKKIITFDTQSSLLIGPNGFGKTTIFDVLELCLTGELYRTVQKSSVTNDNRDYNKPFFQNTENQDVIIKVWLQNNMGEDFIIIKFLPANHSKSSVGRKNKPQEFSNLITYTENISDFEEKFVNNGKKEITENDIESFLKFEEGVSLKEIYNLFNYLQQEESTFFLKKNEKDRKGELDILFQTTDQKEKSVEMNKKLKQLKAIKRGLHEKIKKFENIENTSGNENIKFIKLFQDNDFDFDKENLFEGKADSKVFFDKYTKKIDELIEFRGRFLITEKKKKDVSSHIDTILLDDNNFLDYCILKPLLDDRSAFRRLQEKFSRANSEEEQLTFILQNFITRSDELEMQYDTYRKYQTYQRLVSENILEKSQEFEELIKFLTPELLEQVESLAEFKSLVRQYETLKSLISEIELIIKEIISARNEIHHKYHQTGDEIDKSKCPYCGIQYEDSEELTSKFSDESDMLNELLGSQSAKILEIEEEVKKKFILPNRERIDNYLAQNNMYDKRILQLIKKLSKNSSSLEINTMFKDDLSDDFIIADIVGKTFSDIQIKRKEVEQILKNELIVSDLIYDKLQKLDEKSFDSQVEFLKSTFDIIELKSFGLEYSDKKLEDFEFKSQVEKLKKRITDEKKMKYKYSNEQTKDEMSLFDKYFSADEDEFNKLTVDNFKEKRNYVVDSYYKVQQSILAGLRNKEEKISKIITKISTIKDIYINEIKSYKDVMIKDIKLPFYLYTAKILQNYQQGFGVFLSTEFGNSIRFKADSSNDHDAIHLLSSGQLAVISLAFTLAINKTYIISDELKLLVIDDPIQDMDTMNIHSFIELIKHEFLNDYQLILSTHNDLSAMYMKYKFEGKQNNEVKIIHVQDELFANE